ncbi:hypothetical protein ACD591_04975 [Rufibacter glacialis]|uniref:Uncharacterized protein n=1 Tax=Rufibacter glacialis TaxID=1259555 RepID=A0A5M8QIB0_9BACT|nr:hypothetical protein [Rufibacter glacialis]KAA6434704.1 hypothetical protein FOE74_11030 [Rufibacter glacialis]GGK71730.1 hypothetical protein GCM10011405_19950 [Rufibacter glacialis]
MNHFYTFNREVKNLIKNNPDNKGMQVIERYRKSLRVDLNYYDALEFLGEHLGLELECKEVYERGKFKGYIPQVKLHKGNPYNGKAGIRKITEFPYKSLNKLFDYMSRQYVYFLIDLPDFEKHVFNDREH